LLPHSDIKKSIYEARAAAAAAASSGTKPTDEPKMEYYVHYVEFNKRLDEWIPDNRLILTREMEWPVTSVSKKKGDTPASTPTRAGSPSRSTSLLKKAATKAGSLAGLDPSASKATPKSKASKSKASKKRKAKGEPATAAAASPSSSTSKEPSTATSALDAGIAGATGGSEDDDDDEEDVDMDATGTEDGSQDPLAPSTTIAEGSLSAPSNPLAAPEVFSKEQEIEKLRTSGSMTQEKNEISRVKNLNKLQIGKHEVEAWCVGTVVPVRLNSS
jgi:histone acetyltransferase HTATIP